MGVTDDGAIRTVYVIEFEPRWVAAARPHFNPEIPTFYVGQTMKEVGKRLKEHRRGYHPGDDPGRAAAKIFRDIHRARLAAGLPGTLVKDKDAWVRWDIMNSLRLPPIRSRCDALKHEFETAEELRSRGFQVEGPRVLGCPDNA